MKLELLKLENNQTLTIDSDNYNERELKQFFDNLSDEIEVEAGKIGSTSFRNYNEFDEFMDNLAIVEENHLSEKDGKAICDNLYPSIKESINALGRNIDELVIYPCKDEEDLGVFYFDECIKPQLEDAIPSQVYADIDMNFDYQALGRDMTINNKIVFSEGTAYELMNI